MLMHHNALPHMLPTTSQHTIITIQHALPPAHTSLAYQHECRDWSDPQLPISQSSLSVYSKIDLKYLVAQKRGYH